MFYSFAHYSRKAEIQLMKTFIKTGSTFVLRVFGAFSMMILSIIVTRTTTQTEAGKFFYCLSLIIPIATIARYGTDYSIVKIIGSIKDGYINKYYFYSALRICVVFSCMISLVLIAASYPVAVYIIKDPAYSSLLKIVAVSIPFNAIINIYSSLYQANNKSLLSVFLKNILLYIAVSIITFICAFFIKLDSVWLINIFALTSGLIAFALVYIVNSEIFKQKLTIKTFMLNKFDRYFLKSSYSFFIISIYNTVIQWAMLVIAGFYLINAQIAVINVSSRVANVLVLILVAVNTVISPVFAKYHFEKNIAALNSYYIRTVKALFLITTPILAVFMIFSRQVMSVFGHNYTSYTVVLFAILIGQYINVITGPIAQLYMMSGKENIYKKTLFFTTILSIILPFIGFGLFGINGGAYSYGLILICQNIYMFVRFFIVDYRHKPLPQ